MAKRFKKRGPLHRTHITEWRNFRHLSVEQFAEKMGTTAATVSRVETLRQGYSQDFLEEAAVVLECTPSDLLSRNPNDIRGPIVQAIELLRLTSSSPE